MRDSARVNFSALAPAPSPIVNCLPGLSGRRGNRIGHLRGLVANTVEGAFGLFRVDDYLALDSQVRCHGCPNRKGPHTAGPEIEKPPAGG